MQNSLLKKLLKSKADSRKKLEQLIDEYLKEVRDFSHKKISELFSEVLIFVYNKYGQVSEKEVFDIFAEKIKRLNLIPDEVSPMEVYEKAAVMTASGLGVKFMFGGEHVRAIKEIEKRFLWVKNDATERTQKVLKEVLREAFSGKYTKQELMDLMRDKFSSYSDIQAMRLQAAVEFHLRHAQNLAAFNQANQYGIKYYKIVAVMDSRTTQICRSLNGKLIPAEHLQNQYRRIMNAKTVEDMKAAQSLNYANRSFFQRLPKNIGFPPYHFGCRTHVVPVNVFTDEINVAGEKVKVRYTSMPERYNGKKVLFTHIDNTGVERIVTERTFKHSPSSNARKIPYKKVVSALNSIEKIAEHKDFAGKFVAMSRNGYFIIFKEQELYTIFKPKEPLKKYFNRFAVKSTVEVVKWKKENSLFHQIVKGVIGKFMKKDM